LFGEFKIRGQVILTVKYADNMVLIAKREMVLQGMIDRLIEIGKCSGMEINMEHINILIGISKQQFSIEIMIDQKRMPNVKYFNCLGSLMSNDARCRREIKSRIFESKAALYKKKNLVVS
jgi:hypothetical protein